MSHKIELEPELTDLALLARAAVSQWLPQAKAAGVTVEINLPDEPIVCAVDPMRVQQIISTLLGNAVRFTPGGGRVSVMLTRERSIPGVPESVVIEVTDTGIGIDPEFLPLIFETFTQAPEGLDSRLGGLGPGLATTRAMVELHGGIVSAQSDGRNRGSRFTVRLPISRGRLADDAEDHAEVGADERENDPLHLRVLLIEDSLDTLNMLKLWLGTFGCEVSIADEAMKGVRLATERPPDLIISDIEMPEIDGYELMRRLRKTPGLEHVPAIALSGYARDEDRDLALAAGYNAHMSKPADMTRLLHLIKKITRSDDA